MASTQRRKPVERMFEHFVPMAREMGTRHWERITTMAEMAEANDRHNLALAVYEACLGPGMHEQFLRKKYRELRERLASQAPASGAVPIPSEPPEE